MHKFGFGAFHRLGSVSGRGQMQYPSAALVIDAEKHLYLTNDGTGPVPYRDPNLIPGLAVQANGHPRLFIGSSGQYERALHNTSDFEDFTGSGVIGTGSGGYRSVQLLAEGDGAAIAADTTPLPVGGRINRIALVVCALGETFTLRVEDVDGFEGTSVQFTGTGKEQPVQCSHTFTDQRAGGGRSYILRATGDTGTVLAVNRSWQYRDGDFKMQNLGKVTIENLPAHLKFGIGVEHDQTSLAPIGLVFGDAYENLITETKPSSAKWEATGASITDVSDGILIESNGASWHRSINRFDVSTGVPIHFYLEYRDPQDDGIFLNFRDRVADTACRIFGSPDSFSTTSTAGSLAGIQFGETPAGAKFAEFFVTPNFTGSASLDVGPYSGTSGDSVVLLEAHALTTTGTAKKPVLPVLVGGQSQHAAQVPVFDWADVAPHEADGYGPPSQNGTITQTSSSAGAPWFSNNGEARCVVNQGDLIVSAGGNAEVIAIDGARIGFAPGDLIAFALTIAASAGLIELEKHDGTNLGTVSAGETQELSGSAFVQADGEFISLVLPVSAAGTISNISLSKVAQGTVTLMADYTAEAATPAADETVYVIGLMGAEGASSNRPLELRHSDTGELEANVVFSGVDNTLELAESVSGATRTKLIATRSSNGTVSGKAQLQAAPTPLSSVPVERISALSVMSKPWGAGGNSPSGRLHAFAVWIGEDLPSDLGSIVGS